MPGEIPAAVSVADVRSRLNGFQQVTSPGCSPQMWQRRFSGQPVTITPTAEEMDVLATAATNVINALPKFRVVLPAMRRDAYPWAGVAAPYRPVGSHGEGLFGDFQVETVAQSDYDIVSSLIDGVDASLGGEHTGWDFARVAGRLRRGLQSHDQDASMGVLLEFSSGRQGKDVARLQTSVEELKTLARYPGVFRHLQEQGIPVAESPSAN